MFTPDNRQNHAANLQNIVEHTLASLREAEDYLHKNATEISAAEKEAIQANSERHKATLSSYANETPGETEW